VAKNYYITATSDNGSSISPEGTVTVSGGDSRTFRFSADTGYTISAVFVDGKALSQADIDLGYYTFTYVLSNHTIDVKSILGDGRDPGEEPGEEPGIDSTPDRDGFPWWWIAAALILLLLLFLIIFRMRAGLFLTVTASDGKGVPNAVITYRVEKDDKVENGTEATNTNGKRRIKAKKNSVVTISAAVKDGSIADGLPLIVEMEHRREHRTIRFK
jgi:hypothetical protein